MVNKLCSLYCVSINSIDLYKKKYQHLVVTCQEFQLNIINFLEYPELFLTTLRKQGTIFWCKNRESAARALV